MNLRPFGPTGTLNLILDRPKKFIYEILDQNIETYKNIDGIRTYDHDTFPARLFLF